MGVAHGRGDEAVPGRERDDPVPCGGGSVCGREAALAEGAGAGARARAPAPRAARASAAPAARIEAGETASVRASGQLPDGRHGPGVLVGLSFPPLRH